MGFALCSILKRDMLVVQAVLLAGQMLVWPSLASEHVTSVVGQRMLNLPDSVLEGDVRALPVELLNCCHGCQVTASADTWRCLRTSSSQLKPQATAPALVNVRILIIQVHS